MWEKIDKRRKIVTKPPKWRVRLFSDRQQSDDSNIMDDEDDENDYYEDDSEIEIENSLDSDEDSDSQ